MRMKFSAVNVDFSSRPTSPSP